MSVKIYLRGTQYEYYTNLDAIQGVVELNLNSSESVSEVVVKVEGLAKSLCYSDPGNGKTRSKAPVQETHKVLYLTKSVFPDRALRKTSDANSFTLSPGKHTWPFKFTIPINNDCKSETRAKTAIGTFMQGAANVSQQRHVQQLLPPSMSGSEEVWVRYFVKATVVRPAMLVLNRREYVPFIFLPIEPPRAEDVNGINAFFVKRQHTLAVTEDARGKGLNRLFGDGRKKQGDTIAIEVRMPNPPSLIPGLPASLDVLGFLETAETNINLAISKVTIFLVATTKVKAGNLKRLLANRITCYSQDFRVPFAQSANATQPSAVLSLIGAKPFIIATDTPPTFSTCNIERRYELEIAVTVSHGNVKESREIVSLTCPVTILSGVRAPPPQEERPDLPVRSDGLAGSSTSGASRPVDDLPTYKEAVKVGSQRPEPSMPSNESRVALRTRTSYRVGQDYYQYPKSEP